MRTVPLLLATGLLAACQPGPDREPRIDNPPPPVGSATETGWCAHLAGGPGSGTDPLFDLSALHAQARYFGIGRGARATDDALTLALRADPTLGELFFSTYGISLDEVCVTPIDDRPLVASVTQSSGWYVVRPGTDPLTLPQGGDPIALDLRDLPDHPALSSALFTLLGQVLATSLEPHSFQVLSRTGLTDEAFYGPGSLYAAEVVSVPRDNPRAMATQSHTLAILTSARMPPIAAEWALALRLSGRAYLVGPEVYAAVAEAKRQPGLAGYSAAVRKAELVDRAGRFPDVVAADAASLEALGTPPAANPAPLTTRGGERLPLGEPDDFQKKRDPKIDQAAVRAALLTAHGAAKLFFPYFGTLGDDSDARLDECWTGATDEISERGAARDLLRRFSNVLADGHGWVVDMSHRPSMLPVVFQSVQGEIAVSRTYSPQLAPGDVVTSIEGVDAHAWLSRQLSLTYGATEGHRFFTAVSELPAPAQLEVRDPFGTTRSVTVEKAANLPIGADLYSGSVRAHGFLSDLGAPDLYYLNIDGQHVSGDDEINTHLALAEKRARGLILDLRGHPASGGAMWNPYALMQRIIRQSFDSPRYRVPVLAGGQVGEDAHPYEASYPPLDGPSFAGPVVLILDGRAVSFSDDMAIMLSYPGRVKVVGRTSAGTTGSVTGLLLPGNFAFFLTGMEARFPDGSVHFGKGVTPSVPVAPTIADLAMGRDSDLLAAIAALPPTP